jgi:Sigma-70, region 4
MNEAKRNPDRGAPPEREEPGWPASPVAKAGRPEHPDDAGPAEERQRARTMSRKEMARQFRQQVAAGGLDPELQALAAELEATRPKLRADCATGPRPCPYVSCKFNLYVDVNPRTGSVKMNFPDKELWEIADTCALDVADRGGITLEEVGAIMNLTRERVRQLETRGLEKLRVIADDEPRTPPKPIGGTVPPRYDDDDY